MNKIREVDALNNTMTVRGGCVLANIQQAGGGRRSGVPLSLGAEGSCMIGGNNLDERRWRQRASLRQQLAISCSDSKSWLPDGRVWDGLKSLRKDNTGYD